MPGNMFQDLFKRVPEEMPAIIRLIILAETPDDFHRSGIGGHIVCLFYEIIRHSGDPFLVVILNTDYIQRVPLEFLFYQFIIFAVKLELTLHSFVIFRIIIVRQGEWKFEGNRFIVGIVVSIQPFGHPGVGLVPQNPENDIISCQVIEENEQ